MIVAGYILAVYQHGEETGRGVTPGATPVRRKSSSQTQVPPRPSVLSCSHSQPFFHAFIKTNCHYVYFKWLYLAKLVFKVLSLKLY